MPWFQLKRCVWYTINISVSTTLPAEVSFNTPSQFISVSTTLPINVCLAHKIFSVSTTLHTYGVLATLTSEVWMLHLHQVCSFLILSLSWAHATSMQSAHDHHGQITMIAAPLPVTFKLLQFWYLALLLKAWLASESHTIGQWSLW